MDDKLDKILMKYVIDVVNTLDHEVKENFNDFLKGFRNGFNMGLENKRELKDGLTHAQYIGWIHGYRKGYELYKIRGGEDEN